MPNPFENDDLYSCIRLGGEPSPGSVTLSGHDSVVKWDVKAGSSQSGASMSIKEVPPIEFTATFELILDPTQGIDDFAAWDKFQRLIDSTVSGATPKALDIYHPDLARNRITSVVKASVGGLVVDKNDPGRATVAVKFQQYAPPKPKGGSPKGSSTKKTDRTKAPDPNAAALEELARLTRAYADTPWGKETDAQKAERLARGDGVGTRRNEERPRPTRSPTRARSALAGRLGPARLGCHCSAAIASTRCVRVPSRNAVTRWSSTVLEQRRRARWISPTMAR